MRARLCLLLGVVIILFGARAAAQDASVAGNWRGLLTGPDGTQTPLIVTIVRRGDGYGGFTSGLRQGNEVELTEVSVTGNRLTGKAAADSPLGPVSIAYDLTAAEKTLTGTARLSIGAYGVDAMIALDRAPRRDVPQPQVEQRLEYFVGQWTVDYTGGEYPPLSAGTRTGTATFRRLGDSDFVEGRLKAEVSGEPYEQQLVIGFNPETNALVFRERLPGGVELLSVADWRSPIAINFRTLPVQADGRTYRLRRVIKIISEASFEVTEEFSVDGGPFRRLGNGTFLRAQ